MIPLDGFIVKNYLQKSVSQKYLAAISPKLANCTLLTNLEPITTYPNPIVSSINFNSIPWQAPDIFNNCFFS